MAEFTEITHEDGLPILHYGANTLQDQLTYCHELDNGVIQSATSTLDYLLDENYKQKQIRHGLRFQYDPNAPFILILETFVLHWTAYLLRYQKWIPALPTWQGFPVIYSPPASVPYEDYNLFAMKSLPELLDYVKNAFDIQSCHEASVSMLCQVMAKAGGMVPSQWLHLPGHSEEDWIINGMAIDPKQAENGLHKLEIPTNELGFPMLSGYQSLYKEVREVHVRFLIYRPELHYRLNTIHSTNQEKLELYTTTNVAHPLNPFGDKGHFDVWNRTCSHFRESEVPVRAPTPLDIVQVENILNNLEDGEIITEDVKDQIWDVIRDWPSVQEEGISRDTAWSSEALGSPTESVDSMPGLEEIFPASVALGLQNPTPSSTPAPNAPIIPSSTLPIPPHFSEIDAVSAFDYSPDIDNALHLSPDGVIPTFSLTECPSAIDGHIPGYVMIDIVQAGDLEVGWDNLGDRIDLDALD